MSEVQMVKLSGYTGVYLDKDGNPYDSEGEPIPVFDHPENGNFFLVDRGTKTHAIFPEVVMEDYLDDDGEIREELLSTGSSNGGPRTKPFVAFDTEGKFIDRYEKQMDFVADREEIDNPNGLPPVLKGRVRQTKGYHLFYESEYLETPEGKRGKNEFPHSLHEQYGWKLGQSRSIANSKTEEEEVLAELENE